MGEHQRHRAQLDGQWTVETSVPTMHLILPGLHRWQHCKYVCYLGVRGHTHNWTQVGQFSETTLSLLLASYPDFLHVGLGMRLLSLGDETLHLTHMKWCGHARSHVHSNTITLGLYLTVLCWYGSPYTSPSRIETETVDYSTQYPWSFGILSVVMATGKCVTMPLSHAAERHFRSHIH